MKTVDEIREAALRRVEIWRKLDVDPASEVIQDAAKCERCGESPALHLTLCPKCTAESDDYWHERWSEYYDASSL